MKCRATIVLSVLTLVGCENMGLDYAGTGEEGRNRAPTELVAAVHGTAPAGRQPVIVDGRRWVPDGEPIALDAAELRSVGSSAGQTVYARQWDDAPYDALFIRSQTGGTSARQGDLTRPSGAEGQPGVEGAQATADTAGDAQAPGMAGSPGTAGARGTPGASGPSGENQWQTLLPVIGEDGGHDAGQAGH